MFLGIKKSVSVDHNPAVDNGHSFVEENMFPSRRLWLQSLDIKVKGGVVDGKDPLLLKSPQNSCQVE